MVVPITRGLRFVTDDEPGIRRTGHKRFRYVEEATREPVTDAGTLDRIRSIAVPPAWTDVWISSDSDGHVQVAGPAAVPMGGRRWHHAPGHVGGREQLSPAQPRLGRDGQDVPNMGGATLLAAAGFAALSLPTTTRRRNASSTAVVEVVADELRNTPTVERNSYIHFSLFVVRSAAPRNA